jgi:parallel beta-helix repeat protein
VYNGSYIENVNVNKQLTLAGEGADVVTVTNRTADSHVFNVTVDWVNITGFNVSGATGGDKAGIYLNGSQHCNISNNNASNNHCGIYLYSSSNNTLTSNTVSNNNDDGIYLKSSSNNNTIYNNHFNNTCNAWDNGNNIWNITPTTGTNIIGGSWLGGNYWSDYAGADATGDGLGDTLLPYNSSGNITNGGDYHPLVTPGFAAPSIISSAPESPVNDTYCTWTKFNVSVDQIVNVTWYLNETAQTQKNESVTEANYTFHAEYIDEHNVSAVAENANGTDMQTWVWNVTAAPQTYNCTCGDICVNENGWWRDGSVLNGNGTPIQAAVDDATAGETIYVWNGSYTENVNVNKRLTLEGEGAYVVNVTAASASDHVFEVTANYVNITGFTLENATGNGKAGIYLGDGVNRCNITNNTVKLNYNGIYLGNADDNNITCNWVHHNTRAGFNLTGGSTGNNISHNNIVENGGFNGSSGGWEWLFYNNQNNITDATNNWWGTSNNNTINASIYDWTYNNTKGNVTVLPRLSDAAPCAPVPELSTVILLGIGLLMLAGYLRIRRKG